MKNKILIAGLFIVGIILLISCKKTFLDVPAQGQETSANDPTIVNDFVVGVYNSLINSDPFGTHDIHGFGFISATNIMSDDADKGSTADDQSSTAGQMDNFTVTPSNVFVNTLWGGYYGGISRANQALAALTTATIPSTTRDELSAEVRFIRAYYYFNLVRFYGGVPKVIRVPLNAQDANSDINFQTRSPIDTIYNKVIIPDLEFSIANLPLKSGAALGHITKGAAQAMLAKVYMYRGNWAQVSALTNSVISSNQYSLVANYSELWRQIGDNDAESIFEIQSGNFNNTDFGIFDYAESQGPRVGGLGGWADLGWGFDNPSTDLVNAYEPGDKRKAATIIFIDNSGTHVGTTLFDGFRIPSSDSVQNLYYNYKAYHSENKNVESWLGNRDNKQKNVKILRYADVLLMNAEAATHTGGDALIPLNKIRERAGLPDAVVADQNAIWKERRVELAMEHDRFWDIVRQGRAAQIMLANGKPFVAGKNELLPIPAQQILLSGNKLTQNPGY